MGQQVENKKFWLTQGKIEKSCRKIDRCYVLISFIPMIELIRITNPEFLKIPIVFLELELDQWVILSDSETKLLIEIYYDPN